MHPKDTRGSIALTLRALAHLLNYPDAGRRAKMDALVEALDREAALGVPRLAELGRLIGALGTDDPYASEARYIETFDRGRSTSLHLFEHVHGDSRERGPALVDLARTYEQAGLYLDEGELPDFLPVVLEFASTQPPAQAVAFVGEFVHILNAIHSALSQRRSPYAVVFAALVELAGEPVRAVAIEPEVDLDDAWREPDAFGGCSSAGQSRPDAVQPVHLVRTPRSSTQPAQPPQSHIGARQS